MLLTEPRPVQRPIGLQQKIIRFIMGCVSSKGDRDGPPAVGFNSSGASSSVNRFQVMNVDDTGRRLCPGQLEVGESDLILHQRGKNPVRWPLRSLRRYGFDAELFSFECGRRCPTGPGIYAFHCQRAEVLFNAVQARVAARHEEHELATGHSSSNRMRLRHPIAAHPVSSSILLPGNGLLGNLVGREDVVEEEDGGVSSYLEPIRLHHHLPHQGGPQGSSGVVAWSPNSRPLSSASLISSSSSPISPSTGGNGGVGGAGSLYANNDILMAAAARVVAAEDQQAALLGLPSSAYVNLHDSSSSGGVGRDQDDVSADDDADDQHHLYINVGPEALEVKSSSRSSDQSQQQQQQQTGQQHVGLVKQVNYVLLDLDKGSDSTTTASVTGTDRNGQGQLNSPEGSVASLPDSPSHRSACLSSAPVDPSPAPSAASAPSAGPSPAGLNPDGYATIDFDRTAALSNAAVGAPFSALAGAGEEEGLRKTRHNSTMVATAAAAATPSSASAAGHAARLLGLNRQTSSVSE